MLLGVNEWERGWQRGYRKGLEEASRGVRPVGFISTVDLEPWAAGWEKGYRKGLEEGRFRPIRVWRPIDQAPGSSDGVAS